MLAGPRIDALLKVLSQWLQGDTTARVAALPALLVDPLPAPPDADQIFQLGLLVDELLEQYHADQQRLGRARHETEELRTALEIQRANARELSTPIIEVWPKVLGLPIIGVMDAVRSQEITEKLLAAVVERQANMVIVDITTIQYLGPFVAQHLVSLAQAVRLLGCELSISGMSPQVASAMVVQGLDLSTVKCTRTLYDALAGFLDSSAPGDKRLLRQTRGQQKRPG